MELGRGVDDKQFRYAVALPLIPNRGKLTLDVSLGKGRILEASHHRQTTRWFESGIESHGAARVFIEGCRDRWPPQRQHAVVVHRDEIAWGVIHHHALERARRMRSHARYPERHLGAAFAIARH